MANPSPSPLSAEHGETRVDPNWRAVLLTHFGSSEQGLTSAEAERRLEDVGFNEPTSTRRAAGVVQFLLLFANPLVLILLAASLASALLHEAASALIIVVIVLLSVTVNFVQTFRSQRAADRFRQQVAPTATVLRDGQWIELARRELVPGDMIRLSAGDLVPADARLLEARDLHVQQASLTGESIPAEKEADPSTPEQPLKLEDRNSVFLGSSVVSGTATAVIASTGRATLFGDMQRDWPRAHPRRSSIAAHGDSAF